MTVLESAVISDPRSPLWGDPGWPSHITEFRDHQVEAMDEIVGHYKAGADVVILDAPTGSGKTIVAEGVRRILRHPRSLYTPDTKTLQEQVMSDFGGYARLLKGRANYPTGDFPGAFDDKWNPITAADCTKRMEILPGCGSCTRVSEKPVWHCKMCHPLPSLSCPYEIAKREALSSPLAVLNTSYFIAEANGPASFGWSEKGGTPNQFVIIDEADTLEDVLMNQVEVYLSDKRREKYGIEMPARKTVEASWVEWVNAEALPKIKNLLDAAQTAMDYGDRSTEVLRELRYLKTMYQRLGLLRVSLMTGNAVYDGYDRGDIKFQPVNVAPFGPTMVWRHASRFLLMSATIIDPQQMVEDLGIERAGLSWQIVRAPSTFPKENRPIHVVHGAAMKFKDQQSEWPKMAMMVRKVLRLKHPYDRVLIHTVSYAFTQYLYEQLKNINRPVIIYADSKERSSALDRYKRTPGAVLLAPSMDRGIDLPGDLCRAVIVCKMPFASTKDKRVNARMYSGGSSGQRWYQVQTVRKLVQMTGRGMRSSDDRCDTWILDSQFTYNVWKNSKNLLPKWWVDALDWTGSGLMSA